MSTLDKARPLLGKRVRVFLTQERKQDTIATGILLAFGDDGEAKILDEAGFVHYCWPMLDVEEI